MEQKTQQVYRWNILKLDEWTLEKKRLCFGPLERVFSPKPRHAATPFCNSSVDLLHQLLPINVEDLYMNHIFEEKWSGETS